MSLNIAKGHLITYSDRHTHSCEFDYEFNISINVQCILINIRAKSQLSIAEYTEASLWPCFIATLIYLICV